MELLTIFLLLLAAFLVLGIVSALREEAERRGRPDGEEQEAPHVALSQQVPSVSEFIRRKD